MKKEPKLLELKTDSGKPIYFEIDEYDIAQTENQEADDNWHDVSIASKVQKRLEDSLDSIGYLGKLLREKTEGAQPDKTEIEFGISLEAEANLIIKAGGSASIKVRMTWEK